MSKYSLNTQGCSMFLNNLQYSIISRYLDLNKREK